MKMILIIISASLPSKQLNMSNAMKYRLLMTVYIIIMAAGVCLADVTLPDILADGMVLQREQRVPIWGRADPGEVVSVRFGRQEKKDTAGADGKWLVYLAPMPANATPATMVISGNNSIELQDILVGEVWLLTGQSNMQLTLSETTDGEAAIAAADHPKIKLFNVSRKVAFKHEDGLLATWQSCTPESVKEFSAAGYYFGVDLQKELDVPLGLVNASFGGSQIEAWIPVEYLLASDELRPTVAREKIWDEERPSVKAQYEKDMEEWRAAVEQAKAEDNKPPRAPRVPDALREYRIAASIYNNMIEPLIPFGIRGAFWYQGESNEERAEQYGLLLPTMIKAWRERWNRADLPFGIVQLPNFRDVEAQPTDEAWSHLREQQRRTVVNTPKTGLIVTIDIGEAHDIHPHNKPDVGKRMCRWALVEVYGRNITPTGPMFERAKVKGGKMILWFDAVGKGLKIKEGDQLQEFAIAGADRQWHWAEARIMGKDRIEVWSDKVPKPKAVRYAFNNNPKDPNLTNETGLPASPFRTDNWPGPTHGKR